MVIGVQSKLTNYFTGSVPGLAGALTAALWLCNVAGATLVQPRDPLLAVPMSTLFWVLGLGAMAVALACTYMRHSRLKLALILWFAATVAIFRLALEWQGVHSLSGYTGSLARTFNLPIGLANTLLNLLFLYLLAGSACLLLWDSLPRPQEVPLKTLCTHCGGHIAFSLGNVGEKVACPHCRMETVLQKLGMLKMSCYFCKGHIEFPTYAIGEKIRCPHCKMDISLKEPTRALV
jgi:DNA-directed RNA polymerase subunit RPC12/RpoP